MNRPPGGASFTAKADGFDLRVSCQSLEDAVLRVGLAGCLTSLPFVLWWDLIRDLGSDSGFSFWVTLAFLGAWFAAIVYAWIIGLMTLFGEVRITKSADRGQIFTGIGKLGWTHDFRWSEWTGVTTIVVSSNVGRRSSKRHYVVLEAPAKRYRFGSYVPEQGQAFIVQQVRRLAFPMAAPIG